MAPPSLAFPWPNFLSPARPGGADDGGSKQQQEKQAVKKRRVPPPSFFKVCLSVHFPPAARSSVHCCDGLVAGCRAALASHIS